MISPGVLFNNISNKTIDAKDVPMKRLADYQDVINTVEFLLKHSYITGENVVVDGGLGL